MCKCNSTSENIYNLLYISNQNIICIDLNNKLFKQVFTSNIITKENTPEIIFSLNHSNIMLITLKGDIIIFEYEKGLYYERFYQIKLPRNDLVKNIGAYLKFIKNAEESQNEINYYIFDCSIDDNSSNILLCKFLFNSNKSEMYLYSELIFSKEIITDLVWIKDNKILAAGFNSGMIKIISIDDSYKKMINKYSISTKDMILK